MGDDKVTSLSGDPEYKYSESEFFAPEVEAAVDQLDSEENIATTPDDKKRFNFKNINWRNPTLKKIIGPVLIIVAILVVYFVTSFFATKRGKIAEQKKITMQESAAHVQQQQVAQVQKEQIVPDFTMNNDQASQIQDVVQHKVDGVMQQLTSSQENVVSLNAAVNQTQQEIASVNQRLDQITSTMQQMLKEVEKLKPKPPVARKIVKPKVAYHVRAIVPGRAWLQSARGDEITLRVGDRLEGYGEVLAIVPRQGVVLMSDGSVISLGLMIFKDFI